MLRTDHIVFFLGLSIIRLHYKMTRVPVHQFSALDERDLVTFEGILLRLKSVVAGAVQHAHGVRQQARHRFDRFRSTLGAARQIDDQCFPAACGYGPR
jgi:hypothetical protein